MKHDSRDPGSWGKVYLSDAEQCNFDTPTRSHFKSSITPFLNLQIAEREWQPPPPHSRKNNLPSVNGLLLAEVVQFFFSRAHHSLVGGIRAHVSCPLEHPRVRTILHQML